MLIMNAPPSTIRRSSTSQTSQLHRTSTRNRAVSIDTPTFSANYAGYSQPQNNYAFSGPECSSLAYYHQDSMSVPYGYGGSSSGHKGVYSNTDEETLVESVTSFDTIHPTLGLHPEHGVETSFHSNGRVSMAFGHGFDKPLPDIYGVPVEEVGIDETGFARAPPMNVNIMIVGSRGDVQPYLALGQRLQKYGHTVRLATHETFRKLVKDAGLRFFNIGGDPHELMSYMVRNPGLIPGFKSITNGDIGKKQKMVAEILERCYLSCIEPDDDTKTIFVADAIISNPPTFAHIHCAEALGIPLLLSFTMPWCPTAAFPHPLVNVLQNGSTDANILNYYSYGLVDLMTWQGLGRTINKFRTRRLGLQYLSSASAVGMIERCNIPWTYCLSPALIPKPTDWMNHIDVVGFYFLDMAKDYSPPRDLVEFLNSGPPPVYIGFGSIVLEDPKRITGTILTGVAQAGVRAIISPGWGGLDEEMIKSAGPHVFALGNVPHDWLFQYVIAVAGTTAAGLKCGKPTIIVPFFGDQVGETPWWATQIASRGAGPPPLDHKALTPEMFASAIRIALSPSSLGAAKQVGKMIMREVRDGAGKGVESFHRHLPLLDMKCDLTPNRVAVWYSAKYNLRLSAFAAQVLAQSKHLKLKKLKLHRSREYNPYVEAVDPVTGTLIPALRSLNDIGRGIVKVPTRPGRGIAQVTRASARGIQGTLQGAAEGVSNMPRLYGSEVREHKKVTGLGSGIAQGTKGLVLGIYDGGFYGAVGGLGVGTLNLVAKPVGGALQFVSMPIEGTARSLSHKEIGKERIVARRAEGIVASERASLQEQYAVIEAFVEYKAKRKGDKKGKGKMKA
ncbi:Glycosyltransferase family 1 protein [Rhizoctonia solani]|uniref:Glycosyltransferase family 1 protein n=1 Tax=Rhizoctonia solani TaxID=456999 RepID=A0A8H7HH22_9AGAM|nr:Glycosyltransferase family 1 protein [Rhizoctonia solani]